MDPMTIYSGKYWSQLKIQGEKWSFSNCHPCTGEYAVTNSSILEKAKRKYAHLKYQTEIPLFLWDWAFFSPGSSGFLVTNKALYASTGGVFDRDKYFVAMEDWGTLELKDDRLELNGKKICDLPSLSYTSGHLLDRLAVEAYLHNAIIGNWGATSDFLLKYIDREKSTSIFRYLKAKGCEGDALIGVAHNSFNNEEVIGEFQRFIFTNYHVFRTPDAIRRRTDSFKLNVCPKYSKPTHFHAPHVNNSMLMMAIKVAEFVGNQIEKQNHVPTIVGYDVSFIGLESVFGSNNGPFEFYTTSEEEIIQLVNLCAEIGIPISGYPS